MTSAARIEIWRSDLSARSCRVRMAGELDAATGPQLLANLRRAGQTASCVCLDLAWVTFIDCSGLSALLVALQESRQAGWELELEQPVSRPVARIFRMAEVDWLLGAELAAQAATSAHT